MLDAVCAAWLEGHRTAAIDTLALAPLLEDAARVVVVGIEADWLDALVAALVAATRVGLVHHSSLAPDWRRVQAFYRGRMEALDLAAFQAWAGPRSVLLTCLSGPGHGQDFALPAWLRVSGDDVRTQFRDLVGWRLLRVPLSVYPRWLLAARPEVFGCIVPEVA